MKQIDTLNPVETGRRKRTVCPRGTLPVVFAALVSVAGGGCAETGVFSDYQSSQSGLQRPERILVYDFAVTADEVKENRGFFQGTVNKFEGMTSAENEQQIAD